MPTRRRGVQQRMVMMIVALFVLFLLIVAMTGMREGILSFVEDNECKASVKALQMMHVGGNQVSPNEIDCPMRNVTIEQGSHAQMKRQVADEMLRCWDNFQRGQVNIFDDEQLYCVVCSRLRFEDTGEHLGRFTEFLSTTEIPYNDSLTYMDALLGYKSKRAEQYIENENVFDKEAAGIENQIDTSEQYAVVFLYAKGHDTLRKLKDMVGERESSIIMGLGVGAATAGATATGLVMLTGPPGWIGGVTIGAISGGMALASGISTSIITYFSGEEAYASFIVLKPYTGEDFSELGCDFFPQKND